MVNKLNYIFALLCDCVNMYRSAFRCSEHAGYARSRWRFNFIFYNYFVRSFVCSFVSASRPMNAQIRRVVSNVFGTGYLGVLCWNTDVSLLNKGWTETGVERLSSCV